MGRAVATDETRAIECKHDRQILQGYIVHELVIAALQEGRINRDDRLEPLAGEASGKGYGMLLGDRDVEVAIRKALGIFDEPGAFAHRRRDTDDGGVSLSHVAEPVTKDL